MAKRRKKTRSNNNAPRNGYLSRIAPATKKSVIAILALGFSTILILASIGKAGPVGNVIFIIFSKLFGIGYYLIPAVGILVAILFLSTLSERFIGSTLIGATALIVLGLGLIDIFLPQRGGFFGNIVGALELPFGTIAATIVLITLIAAAFLLTFNISVRLPRRRAPSNANSNHDNTPDTVLEREIDNENDELNETNETESEPINSAAKDVVVAKQAAPPPKSTKQPKRPIVTGSYTYVAPPLSLLKSTVEKPTAGDLRANANIIKRTLDGFGIPVEMGEVSIGPKVTRYTLKPAEGVKLSRITALHQDLSLALAAHPIRIEAPIPGKSFVGVEVPNRAAAIVRLGSLISYPEFSNSGPLVFPLGRDVSGEPIFANLEQMPHLLIAGSTGSGKSICIHSIITSFLYKNSPKQLHLALIDPKRVELSIYDGIPHLVTPVITDVKKSIGVFQLAIKEMDRRYNLLLKAGARDIRSYNQKRPDDQLPHLLIVIDELADLMARYGREVEGSIVRLAQMARATGINLILSTQRPSVEVITGLIKANITARIALQVASQIDSRTILDTAGAEKLLGGGDLLFISSDFGKPKRIQGAYIGETEIKTVTEFVADHNIAPEIDKESLEDNLASAAALNNDALNEYLENDGSEEDELFADAVSVIRETKQASATFLQRRLRIGYARAARIIDSMESKGLVGPLNSAKQREIFMNDET